MSSAFKELFVVCAVILDDDGRVFVAKRPRDKILGGKWEFPGGKIDTGERPEEALRREIREELGATIVVLEPLNEVVNHSGPIPIRLLPFRAEVAAGVLQPLEHEEIQWIELQELRTIDLAEADIVVADELMSLAGLPR